jgi:hypothetical protein
MEYDEDKVDEMVLALLFLTTFEESRDGARAWKDTTGTYSIGSMQRATFQVVLCSFPEVPQCTSQVGRPDDGTDTTGFSNTEYFVDLKPKEDGMGLPMLATDLPVCFTSIVKTPFFYDSNLQIPQSDFRAIPATCLVNDSSQVSLDYVFCGLDLCCDLRIRASLENKRCDSPLSTCKSHVSRQQRHYLNLIPNTKLATCMTSSQSR